MKPFVAIVGRPNVGKSSLFNRILGDQRAVVDDEPGVTRDRNYASTDWCGRAFVLVDTGGYVPASRVELERFVREQADVAISQADAILLVVDVTSGVTDLDGQVARTLRRGGRPCVVVANKADNESRENEAFAFNALGLGEPVAVSALNGRSIGHLLDRVVSLLPEDAGEPDAEDSVRIAVVGRPNVGKSSFVNAVSGENRAIVQEAPGTTRDSLDTEIEYEGRRLVLVDTAGLRGMRKIRKEVEYYASLRTIRSLERCDVALLLVDSSMGVTVQDVKILDQILASRKGAVLVANKWDLVEKDSYTAGQFVKHIREAYPFAAHIPVALTSALTGKRTRRALQVALEVYGRGRERVPTGRLNELLQALVAKNPPPMEGGRQPRLLYCTQHGTDPPSFVFFCSDAKLIGPTYRRYVENQIRAQFGFEGCSIVLRFKSRKQSERR